MTANHKGQGKEKRKKKKKKKKRRPARQWCDRSMLCPHGDEKRKVKERYFVMSPISA